MSEGRRSTRLGVVLAAIVVVVASGGVARAETLRGSVQTADGRPAQGAKVWGARLWTNRLDRRETAADDLGRFTLELEPGPWLVWASLGVFGAELSDKVDVQAGQEPPPIRLTLAEWGRLSGRLIEAETDKT